MRSTTPPQARRVLQSRRALPAGIAALLLGAAGLLASSSSAASAFTSAPAPSHPTDWHATAVPVVKGDVTAVAALSDTQAWAVGYRLNSLNDAEALALHWDGTSWTQLGTLPRGAFPQVLAARTAEDIWEAGAVTAHWNGTAWTPYRLARDPAGMVRADGVTITADGHAWIVGQALPGQVKNGVPAIQYFDGTAWQRQALPDVGRGELDSVAATGPDDVWAGGVTYATGPDAPETSLLFHWDGTSWTRITSPDLGQAHTWIGGLAALGKDDVWAVGGATVGGVDVPFAIHWDGRRWAVTLTPPVPDGRLRAVGRSGDGELWAVGGKGAVSVALRWDPAARVWLPAPDAGLVTRSFATVPGSSTMWTVGLSKQGDLTPAISQYQPTRPDHHS